MKHTREVNPRIRPRKSFRLGRRFISIIAVAVPLFGVMVQPTSAQTTLGQVQNLRMKLISQSVVSFCGDRVEGAKGYMIYLNGEIAATISQPRQAKKGQPQQPACWRFDPARTTFRGNWAFPQGGVSQFQMVAYDKNSYGPMSNATSIIIDVDKFGAFIELTPESLSKCVTKRYWGVIVAESYAAGSTLAAVALWRTGNAIAAAPASVVAVKELHDALRAEGQFYLCFTK